MTCEDTCGALGSYFKMAVSDSDEINCDFVTPDNSWTRMEILSESISYTDTVLVSKGLTGSLDPLGNHLRPGPRIIRGRILMEVGVHELNFWWPKIFGNEEVPTDIFETAPDFDPIPFDLLMNRDAGVHQYRGCQVNRALLRNKGVINSDEQVMQLTLDIRGLEEKADAVWPNPEPLLTASDRFYWLHGDGKLYYDTTAGGALEEWYFDSFNLMINNKIVPKIRNFLRATCLQSNGREIKLQTSIPYTPQGDLDFYQTKFDGPGEITFNGSNNNLESPYDLDETKIEFPRLYQTRITPNAKGPGEIPMPLVMQAFRTSSDIDGSTIEPITVTNTVNSPA